MGGDGGSPPEANKKAEDLEKRGNLIKPGNGDENEKAEGEKIRELIGELVFDVVRVVDSEGNTKINFRLEQPEKKEETEETGEEHEVPGKKRAPTYSDFEEEGIPDPNPPPSPDSTWDYQTEVINN